MAATILTVAQQKGGAGKTTLAAQLAVAWAAESRRVAVVDIDPQASLGDWHRIRAEVDGPLAGPLALSSIAGWRVSTELGRLRRAYDIIVIDSPPHAETEAKVAVREADLVLVPVQPSPMDVWATQPTMDLAASEKTPALVVLNRVPPRGRVIDTVRRLLTEQGRPVAAAALGNRVAFIAAMMEGKGVIESAPRSPAAEEVRTLAAEVGQRLGLRPAAA